jgi:hypothetical protein
MRVAASPRAALALLALLAAAESVHGRGLSSTAPSPRGTSAQPATVLEYIQSRPDLTIYSRLVNR